MKRFLLIIPLFIFVIIGGVAAVMLNASLSGGRNSQAIGFSMQGAALPLISMTAFDGGGNSGGGGGNSGGAGDSVMSLGAYRGQAFAINVFASWCTPCKLEAPMIARLSERLPVIGINYRDTMIDAHRFLEQFGNPYTAIGVDGDGSISIQLGVHGLPETFIISTDGVILYHLQGPLMAAEFDGIVDALLAEVGL